MVYLILIIFFDHTVLCFRMELFYLWKRPKWVKNGCSWWYSGEWGRFCRWKWCFPFISFDLYVSQSDVKEIPSHILFAMRVRYAIKHVKNSIAVICKGLFMTVFTTYFPFLDFVGCATNLWICKVSTKYK